MLPQILKKKELMRLIQRSKGTTKSTRPKTEPVKMQNKRPENETMIKRRADLAKAIETETATQTGPVNLTEMKTETETRIGKVTMTPPENKPECMTHRKLKLVRVMWTSK